MATYWTELEELKSYGFNRHFIEDHPNEATNPGVQSAVALSTPTTCERSNSSLW